MSAFLDAAISKVSAGRTDPRIFEINKVDTASVTYPYSVVSVTPVRPFARTLDATHHSRDYRIVVQSFGRTEDAVSDYNDEADERLLDQSLTVAGFRCDPCRFTTTRQFRDADDSGVIGITTTFTFAATKETS